ncbi:Zinc finger, CCHC-type [Cinara cedri]|uniref:Zinc finger, CCHC-type n=1 Tax=Cinara cedri TaxID=506608 RepID=A0A5E4NPI3_9HEMI|nr:Zinc finger, CCHC-type [Cinara cedri]
MNQAIVMNSVDGIKQIQYIIALNKIIDATNIISASCISNNRFCVFLKCQQITNDLINKHLAIYIDNIEIPIRKLINPSKRIILSNVYLAIPNNIIIKALVNLDVKITSPITALKAGFQLDQFAHITSFRRQLYINPKHFPKLPGSIAIALENTTYRIFITDDTVTCFLCKKTGHVSSSCKTTYFNEIISEDMDISNEQTATDIKTNQPNEKIPNTNEISNEPKTINSNSFLSQNMDSPNDNSAIKIHS